MARKKKTPLVDLHMVHAITGEPLAPIKGLSQEHAEQVYGQWEQQAWDSVKALLAEQEKLGRERQNRHDKEERSLRSPKVRARILKALPDREALTAQALANRVARKNNSRFRAVLARMVKDGLLTNEEGCYRKSLSRP
jgi:hypothetical protein